MGKSDLEAMVGSQETIVWRGKPDKKCFVLESIFNEMLPLSVLWIVVEGMAAGRMSAAGTLTPEKGAWILGLFSIHMFPVWMYLAGIAFSVLRHKHTQYIITDKGIYVSGGVFTFNYEMKPFTDLSHINIHRGILDQFLGVGDVISVCNHDSWKNNTYSGNFGYNRRTRYSNHQGEGMQICDIPDYQRVFGIIKQLQTDIYADTQYPNDLRPTENHGYQTRYRGGDNWF